MKKTTILAVCIAVSHLVFALPASNKTYHRTQTAKALPAINVSHDIHEMLLEILNVTGLHANFELKEAKVLNIEAFISHRKRYILYNSSFIGRLNDLTKNKWAVMTLLAHEVGHHLNGHTISKEGSSPELELQADEFAGFIMHKLGATLEQCQSVMNYVAKAEESKTHPSKSSRKLAIEKGWNKAVGTEAIAAAKL